MMAPRPPTSTLFPYTTLFRSDLTITSGTLAMNAGGGTLAVGGNWTDAGTRSEERRTVIETDAEVQCRLQTGGKTQAARSIDKALGNLVLGSNQTLTATAADVL